MGMREEIMPDCGELECQRGHEGLLRGDTLEAVVKMCRRDQKVLDDEAG